MTKKAEAALSEQRLREAFARPPVNLKEDVPLTGVNDNLPPKQVEKTTVSPDV